MSYVNSPLIHVLTILFIIAAVMRPGPVLGGSSADPGATPAVEVEAVMVTAQKREQDVREVPIAVSVFDGFDLEDMNVESVRDVMVYTPNMSYFAAGGEGVGTPTIRGLTASLRSFATSTALYVDGIPYTRGFGFDTLLQDIQRIEVLKGPQGTLYGKNAEAGVVNVTTRKPGNLFKGGVRADGGEDKKMAGTVSISGPLVKDKLFAGVLARHYEKEGFMTNTLTGDTVNDEAYDFGKLNLIFRPTQHLGFSFLLQNIRYDNGDLTLNDINAPDPRQVTSDLAGYDRPSSLISGLTTTWEKNNLKLEAILTYWDYQFDSLNDFDFSHDPANQYHLRSRNEFEKVSAEFRAGSGVGPFSWLLGIYADRDDDVVDNTMTLMGGAYEMEIDHELGARTLGVFGHATWDVTDRVSLVGGLRYDRDEKEFTEPGSGLDEEDSYDAVSPKLAVQYRHVLCHRIQGVPGRRVQLICPLI